jgi:hypothetical protein
MEFISIGPNCATINIINNAGLKKKSYPFDYIFSSLQMIKHSINDRFNLFLDKTYYRNDKIEYEDRCEDGTQHLFYSTFIDTEILKHHHIANNLPEIANNLTNQAICLHHNLFDDNIYEGFVRRCNRLLDLIDNNKKIVFVYYNQYTNEFNDLLDFYNNFSENKNIYVIGIFENNGEQKMLYDSFHCKIYQNYDKNNIFNEIQMFVNAN